jgi:S1/P1 Nuclease
MQRGQSLILFWILMFASRPACAWNDVGHMAVARIAYEKLTDSERATISAILRQHPHLHEVLLKDRPAHASIDEWLFLRAATWPDNVRPPRDHHREPVSSHPVYRFHHSTWHYVNFEFRAGQQESTLPSEPLPNHPSSSNPADQTNIIQQLDHSYLIVRGREREFSEPELELSPGEIRAVRMCWLFHLMGDIHQPLHVTTFVEPRIPVLRHGDDGGNKLTIRVNHASSPRNLHAVCDEVLGTNSRFEKIVQLAERLSHDPRLAVSRFSEFERRRLACEFAEESYRAAKEIVYQNGYLHYALSSRVESHELTADNVPVMTQQWINQLHALAERRIVLAGHRLAERLKFIVSQDLRGLESLGKINSPKIWVQPAGRFDR